MPGYLKTKAAMNHRVMTDHLNYQNGSTIKGYQAYFSAKAFIVAKTSSDVSAPLTISTNFMIGGGFIKCMPITCKKMEKGKRKKFQPHPWITYKEKNKV